MPTPRRIVSLQPSVTVTLDRLGLLDRVVACTRWCRDLCPALAEVPRLIVADSWSAKAPEIMAARPDLVIASVPYRLEAVAEILKAGVPFLGLAPRALEDVYGDIGRIAGILGCGDRGERLVLAMRSEIGLMRERSAGRPRPLVYCEEWGKPLIHSQAWVAELVDAAGGTFLGAPGATTDAETVRLADPEVIVFAWCGAGDRVPLEKVIPARAWEQTRAARARRVYCVRDEFLNTPAPTLLDGLKALVAALHPQDAPAPPGLRRIGSFDPRTG
jgi:iron complex transport system substrate-binding protein